MPFFNGDIPQAKVTPAKSKDTAVTPSRDVVSEPQKSIKKNGDVKPKAKKKILSSFSISINPSAQVKEVSEVKEPQETVSKTDLNQPLEAEALKKAWEALRQYTPGDQITLKQCIKTNYPKILSNSEFSYTVSNNFQADNLRDNSNLVIPFLQERLQNSNLQMIIEVSDKTESTVVFTANDKFKLMLEKNPELEQLRKRLDLELD